MASSWPSRSGYRFRISTGRLYWSSFVFLFGASGFFAGVAIVVVFDVGGGSRADFVIDHTTTQTDSLTRT